MSQELKHFGVMGMRWGHRKAEGGGGSSGGSARKNNEQALSDTRRVYGSKGSGKDPRHMTDKEIDDEITRISSGPQSKETRKRIDVENAKLEMKRAQEHAKQHPEDGDAQVAAYRAEVAHDKAMGRKYVRLGKKKGQSDEDYDKEFDAEVEDTLRKVADANRKVMDKKAAKKAEKQAKDEGIAQRHREAYAKEVEDSISWEKQYYGKRNEHYDEAKSRADWEKAFKRDLNYSVADLKRDRVKAVVATVAYFGAMGLLAWHSSKT